MTSIPFPASGTYVQSVSESSWKIREKAGITVTDEAIKRLLFSESFTTSFPRLRESHGMALPLKFPSVLAELNLLCILSLLNFASGYRVPLHIANGRGAFDNIRALVFSMYITADTEGDYLSAHGMQHADAGKIADFMGVADKIHQEKDHASIPGLRVGELGGPVWEVVQLVTNVLKETGDVLVKGGYPNLGAFVLEAFKEGEKVRTQGSDELISPECDVILERLVRAIPAFQDMVVVDGQPVYCFKKALLTIYAVARKYQDVTPSPFPLPRISHLPIFSDNVIPSLLVHLGVIDLTTSDTKYGVRDLFPGATEASSLRALLSSAPPPPLTESSVKKNKTVPREGPILTTEEAFILRAAAIDACNRIVEVARNLDDEEIKRKHLRP
ncbi:hypothetical protein EIP91_003685 [Steccherinum ochraceum]|uniref:Queuosine 5'-phosphate N-glycosylase/hydrolase n=1 Tax=Steccherinum ochraceum TaxID=92696 RepID=A0A4R0RII2_9APHY|nr:hypothetical protein EIP91_003685 [Steccherinum ochraceum]